MCTIVSALSHHTHRRARLASYACHLKQSKGIEEMVAHHANGWVKAVMAPYVDLQCRANDKFRLGLETWIGQSSRMEVTPPFRHPSAVLFGMPCWCGRRLQGNSAYECGDVSKAIGAYDAQLRVLEGLKGIACTAVSWWIPSPWNRLLTLRNYLSSFSYCTTLSNPPCYLFSSAHPKKIRVEDPVSSQLQHQNSYDTSTELNACRCSRPHTCHYH